MHSNIKRTIYESFEDLKFIGITDQIVNIAENETIIWRKLIEKIHLVKNFKTMTIVLYFLYEDRHATVKAICQPSIEAG